MQGARGGAAAYVLARLLLPVSRPALVLVADSVTAERVAAELSSAFGEGQESDFLTRRVHLLPAREAPALEMVSPPLEVEAARSAALYQLAAAQCPIVVASPEALASRTDAKARLLEAVAYLVVGDELDRDAFADRLEAMGYRRRSTVEEAGEMAVRGGIIDLWAPGYALPVRLELLGDTLESLRSFDPSDQCSRVIMEELAVLPPRPFDYSLLATPEARRGLAERADQLLLPSAEVGRLDACMATGKAFTGVEMMLPYATSGACWADRYLGEHTITVVIDREAVVEGIEATALRIDRAEEAAREAGTFFPLPATLYVSRTELLSLIERRPLVEVDLLEKYYTDSTQGTGNWLLQVKSNGRVTEARTRMRAARASGFKPMAEALSDYLDRGMRVVVMASDATQLVRLGHLLGLEGMTAVATGGGLLAVLEESRPAGIYLVEGHFDEGFNLEADRLAVVTDQEIFGRRRYRRRRRSGARTHGLSDLGQIGPGDHIVHADHGIGLYHGLKHIKVASGEGDFLHIEYAGGDRYYLPVDRITLVEKYTGGLSEPKLDRLGGAVWARTKKKARDSVMDMARELLETEAFRGTHERPALAGTGPDFEEFEAQFAFEETPGQQRAIDDVVRDLCRPRPMDRLVCGDVGYGKTEVALRAAYLTALAGRQVAFLVPTTVLARQHYKTLLSRFEGYPVRVGMLSRLNTAADNAEVLEGLRLGQVDIVVGTHRLLQKDVSIKRLGLMVVDEEHRFGVRAKERIKKLRREIDILTLTATPIPRTLQLALSGVRDLSLIETAPVDRLAIRTYIVRYDEGLVRQAVRRELDRSGQTFFVHNRVVSIQGMAERLSVLIPEARIAVAHGQMHEKELDTVMTDFIEQRVDLLVCTSIIESGLDIPNANTIVINRADTFGLAELYQIRGRVGRSYKRAYAYLMVPAEREVTEQARRRLDVLSELDDLGSGFRLAAHDLEIRGAGNLLGKEQSGSVAAVGFDLYMRMLEEASCELRGEDVVATVEPEIELARAAFIPDDYVEDVSERLLLYKRIAAVGGGEELRELAVELIDRFGPLPSELKDFLRQMGLRPALKALSVESLSVGGGRRRASSVSLRFREDSRLDPRQLTRLACGDGQRYRIRPGGMFTMTVDEQSWDAMVDRIEDLLGSLEATLGEASPS